MNTAQIKTDAKKLLGISTTDKDDIIELLIDIAIDTATAYCRVTSLPDEAESIITMMTVRAYHTNEHSSDGVVKSWSQGSRSETYSDGSELDKSWFYDFTERLEPYRKRRGRLPSEIV